MFWVYLTYQGGAEERQEQLLAGSVSFPLGGTPLTCPAWWDSSPPSAWHTQASYPLQCTATAYVSLTFGYTALLYVIALVYHAIPKHMMQLSAQCSTLLGPQCIPPQGLPFWLYIIKILHWKVHGISNQFVCSSGYCCFVSCIASSRCSGLWILCIAEQHQSIVLDCIGASEQCESRRHTWHQATPRLTWWHSCCSSPWTSFWFSGDLWLQIEEGRVWHLMPILNSWHCQFV